MKFSQVLAISLVVGAGVSGCSPIMGKPYGAGWAYSDVKFNERTEGQNAVGMKQGQSCASAVLGVVATGDASVATAAKAAGITKVASVDGHNTNILGIYSTYCVIVTGE
ncbi:MAG: TRL domain-containing protein [Deltaproteobacteria bacterium]|nr:TRL domain-containing protein [Deltaproteobacteria bacterium]